MKRQLCEELPPCERAPGFVRPLLSRLSGRTRYVFFLERAVRHCASGGTTSGSTATRTQRGGSSSCVLLFKRGESFLAPWFVCLRCVGACSLLCWACGRLWRLVLSSGSVGGSCRLAALLWALSSGLCFFLVSLLRPTTCRAGSPWWSDFQGGATTQGPFFGQVSPFYARRTYVRYTMDVGLAIGI